MGSPQTRGKDTKTVPRTWIEEAPCRPMKFHRGHAKQIGITGNKGEARDQAPISTFRRKVIAAKILPLKYPRKTLKDHINNWHMLQKE